MARRDPCPKCGSDKVLPDGDVRRDSGLDRGIQLRVKNHPERAILTMAATAALRARVCVDCGHVELYVSDLAALRGIHQERSNREASP